MGGHGGGGSEAGGVCGPGTGEGAASDGGRVPGSMSFVQDGVIRAARLLVWPASIRVGGARNLDRGALVLEAAQEFELIITETAFRRGVETARGEREFEFPHDEGRETLWIVDTINFTVKID